VSDNLAYPRSNKVKFIRWWNNLSTLEDPSIKPNFFCAFLQVVTLSIFQCVNRHVQIKHSMFDKSLTRHRWIPPEGDFIIQ
jgi:hypothetical protein